MRTWLILLTAGASLVGCATSPAPNPWDDITVPLDAPAEPVATPALRSPVSVDGEMVTFDIPGALAIDNLLTAAETNEAIARAHAAQIVQLRLAIDGLVEAGRAQRMVAEMRAEMLEDTRRQHTFEKAFYWVVIGALAVALP